MATKETDQTMNHNFLEVVDNMETNVGGTKRVLHLLDSNKEKAQRDPHKSLKGELQLALVDHRPRQWTKVKNKKGKKGEIEDYLNS
jgi:hypothetical protein